MSRRFRFEYEPGIIRFGAGTIDDLGSELASQAIGGVLEAAY